MAEIPDTMIASSALAMIRVPRENPAGGGGDQPVGRAAPRNCSRKNA